MLVGEVNVYQIKDNKKQVFSRIDINRFMTYGLKREFIDRHDDEILKENYLQSELMLEDIQYAL